MEALVGFGFAALVAIREAHRWGRIRAERNEACAALGHAWGEPFQVRAQFRSIPSEEVRKCRFCPAQQHRDHPGEDWWYPGQKKRESPHA